MNFKNNDLAIDGWKNEELNSICDVIDSLHKTPQYSTTGYPMIRVKDLYEGYFKISNPAYVPEEVYEEFSKKYKPKLGDILFSRVGSYGIASFVNTSEAFCLGQNTVGISNFCEDVYNKFVYYSLISPNVKKQIEALVTGSTQKTISMKSIKSFKIAIPPLQEQKAIAHILSTLDEKIEVNNQINKTLENMAQAIFKQWFMDFEFPNEDGEPYKSSGGEMVESELGMIPKGWEVKELVDVLETLEAGNRPKGGAGNLTEGIPSIGAENIIGLGKYDYSKEKYVTEEYFAKMNKGKVNPGDVLLYKDGAQLGRKTMFMNGFPHKKCCINSHVFILRTNDMLTQSYLYFWLDQDWVTQSIINLNANSAQPGINQSKLKTLKILTPKFNYVEMFDVIIKSLLNKLFENCIENNALHKTRDALLPKLMSGEIRVPLDEEGDAS